MIRKFLYAIHRISGTVLSIFFLAWFLSGFVMIYHGFPRASHRKFLKASDTLKATDLKPLNDYLTLIPDSLQVQDVFINRYLGETQITIKTTNGKSHIFSNLGEKIVPPEVNIGHINRTAKAWCGDFSFTQDTLTKLNQWLPFSSRMNDLPIYKLSIQDPEKTELFLSSKTGEVVQCTTAKERFWAWIGAIPHWIYFYQLRQNAKLWSSVVIWLSGIGCIMVISGMYVGIDRFWRASKKKKKLKSPYKKGSLRWHHWSGIIFGIIALTWAFSGMMSMTSLPKWITGERNNLSTRSLYTLNPCISEATIDYRDVLSKYSEIKELKLYGFNTKLIYELTQSDGNKIRLDASKEGAPKLELSQEEVTQAIQHLFKTPAEMQCNILTSYDAYYNSTWRQSRALPVFKIEVSSPEKFTIYANPKTTDLYVYDSVRKMNYWAYSKLHALRFGFLTRHPILWTIVIWGLLLGGVVVSFTGVILGIKYIIRLTKRRKR